MVDAWIFSAVILRLVSSVMLYLRKLVQVVPARLSCSMTSLIPLTSLLSMASRKLPTRWWMIWSSGAEDLGLGPLELDLFSRSLVRSWA